MQSGSSSLRCSCFQALTG
ncbi:MAG: hypothetical protein E6I50_05760 [Chloroflexi bacterium]|nr:MAG: hypothetical protein E6I50_05760 [Chloroflexota bacterium]